MSSHLNHQFEPVFDQNSMANITGEEIPKTVDEKKRLLLQYGIAVWDVITSCSIIGSIKMMSELT